MPLLPSFFDELDLERQPEVAGGQVAAEELVALQAGGLADDLAVLDRPELRVALPAGEVAAVEEGRGVLGRGQHRHLAGAGEVGDERADLVVGERRPEVVGHHRLARSACRSSISPRGMVSVSLAVTRVIASLSSAWMMPVRTRPSVVAIDVGEVVLADQGARGRGRSRAGNRGRRGSSRSARARPCRRSPNSVWHCWQVLAKTARPRSRSGVAVGLGREHRLGTWRSAGPCRRTSRGRCPRPWRSAR